MIKEFTEKIKSLIGEEPNGVPLNDDKKIILLDPAALGEGNAPEQMNSVGLFCDVTEEKTGEVIHGILYLNHLNKHVQSEEELQPIEFYISTYGGSADDMFGLYDVMRNVRETSEIHTVGVGKVFSAGVLLLAAGTKGTRKVGRNCRIMIHSVIGGNQGDLHNMLNEMEAIEQLQQMFVDCLAMETKMTKKQIKKMLERKVNVYLSAEEAVELGIADIII